ncbi:hypothetical protein JVU11DRAFT_3746 [Chiua virens]|nr:hypothetical protein JVU11DRAFT_3746 [Chiua virens]
MGSMETDKASINVNDGLKSSPKDQVTRTIDKTALFWEKYSEEAEDCDKDFLETNVNSVEGVLIFAGLFSAVAASFLVSTQANLVPNPTDTTNALLMMLVQSSNNTALANQTVGLPKWDGPSSAVICSQILGYAALSASLLAALGAVLGKQWLSDFTRLRNGPLQERGRRRQQKLDGLRAWRFEVVMGALPALIQLALLLFSISLAINLWNLNHEVGSMVIIATTLGVLLYLFITLASLLSPTCPFHTPVSSTIHAAIRTAIKSIEEIAEYWAWRSDKGTEKRPTISGTNRILALVIGAFVSSLLIVASVTLLVVIAICTPIFALVTWIIGGGNLLRVTIGSFPSVFQFGTLQPSFHNSASRVRDSARRARDFIRRTHLDPQPDFRDSDPRSIAWLLETSTDPDNLMAAAELVPDVKWPEDLDISLPTEHLYSIFIRSITETGSSGDRALPLGKAFVIMLCQMSREVSPHVWRSALRRVKEESLKPDVDSDLLFVLTIVTKLLSHKLDLEDRGVDFPSTREVSQSLLAWLLQPLEILLQLDHPRQSRFLPEAYRVFLKLKWPEESKLEREQEVQYCRTFEIYFNSLSVVGSSAEQPDEVTEQSSQDLNVVQTECLRRILAKLKAIDPSRLPDIHQHLIVPLTVLARLTSIAHLTDVFKAAIINPWMIEAFKEAVGKADKSGTSIWLFASCVIQLATGVDAFDAIEDQVGDHPGEKPISLKQMDSETLLSYLLNKETSATSEQTVYALQIMLASENEHPALSRNPDFVTYILYATAPGQVYSIRDIGLKVLIATCKTLLQPSKLNDLLTISDQSDFPRLLRRAILTQDPPIILKDLLRTSDEDFNESLLKILAPVLGDPFNTLLNKLRDEPNKIPERDLRDLEIALVLSKQEGRKSFFYDHLDHCIRMMPLREYKDTMALPFAVIVGWLLRRDGPINASESLWKALLRPSFEELLFPAWADPDTLEDNPQMLRQLLDCTTRWLSTYVGSESPNPATLARLGTALAQLRSRMLSSDIKRALQKLSREIQRPSKD